MDLDVNTMFVVTISVTAILGFLLLFSWYQQRRIQSLAWWGCAHLLASAAVWMIGMRGSLSLFWSVDIANALLFIACGMVWNGARLFDGYRSSLIGIFGGAAAWLMATQVAAFMTTANGPVMFSSMIIAAYTFATALEFLRGRNENLMSRMPVIVMMAMHGVLYLARIPLIITIPLANEPFFSATWFGVIGLESLLYMIATAFILLALAKERAELEQKAVAMIDSLTATASRRAFLEESARRLQQRSRNPQPVSMLLFDLDRFKKINDKYGHAVGDRVLRIFSQTAISELRSTDLLGRLGGEEFAAYLAGTDVNAAAVIADRIRVGFEKASAELDGYPLGGSVSVGIAGLTAHESAEIGELLTQADKALYMAKTRGRNRIEIADEYFDEIRRTPRGEWGHEPVADACPDAHLVAVSLGLIASPSVAPEGELGVMLRRNLAAAPVAGS